MAAAFVLVDVVSTDLAWMLAYYLRFHSDLVSLFLPVTKGLPDFSRYLLLAPRHLAPVAGGPLFPRPLPGQARPQPHRRVLRHPLQRAHRLRPDPGRHAVRPRLLPLPARRGPAVGVQPGRVRPLRDPGRHRPERWAAPRCAPTSSGCGPRATTSSACSSRGRASWGSAWRRRSWATASWATAWWGSWTTRRRPAHGADARAGRPLADHGRGLGPRRGPALHRAAARGARQAPEADQERAQRVRGHQGHPRPGAVRHHQGRPRGPRRDPDHQPQRGPAARLEQHAEAGHGRGGGLRPPGRRHPVPAVHRAGHQAEGRQGPGLPAPGAHDPGREDFRDLQVPHHGGRGGEGDGADLGQRRGPAPDPRSGSGCAGSTWTRSRSS